MINTLITSKTRIKLLFKFFLNGESYSYLRNLEQEFGESTNAIRLELNRFEKSGLLLSWNESNRKLYKANPDHPMYSILQKIVYRELRVNSLLNDNVLNSYNIIRVYLIGNFNEGINNYVRSIVFIRQDTKPGEKDKDLEKELSLQEFNFNYNILSPEKFIEYKQALATKPPVLIWKAE